MNPNQPLVTIGIPTYNRAALLKRSIESALNQHYQNIEVIVSDNASTDGTESVCRYYSGKDTRLKYIHHSKNRGPTANFIDVLKNASGYFFMWLGDDDWIDQGYVTACVKELMLDKHLALVSGVPRYYKNGQSAYVGYVFNLSYDSAWERVIAYYLKVKDNGTFYGLMRTAQLQQIEMRNTMGGDWLLIASIIFMGKSKVVFEISVHRELGGATLSFRKIANSLGLPKFQEIFPMTSVAIGACMDIVIRNSVYRSQPAIKRWAAGIVAFFAVLVNAAFGYLKAAIRRFRKNR